MQLLTDARQRLQSCARTAQSPLLALEQKGQQIERQLSAMRGQTATRLSLLRQRALAFESSLELKAKRTRAALEKPFGGVSSGALSALEAVKTGAAAQARGFQATAASLEAVASGLEDLLTTAGAELSRGLAAIKSARAAVTREEQRGLGLLADAEQALEALKRSLLDQLARIEAPVLQAIETIRSAANLFIDETRAVIRSLKTGVASATSPVLAGADQLSQLVIALETKAGAVIGQVASLAAAVTGAIDMIPVNALPEPMAKPAVDALSQVASQFATQLQTGAQAASSQLKLVSDQISTAIEQGQQQLSEQLDAVLKPLFAQIDSLVAQIDAQRQSIEAKAQAQLSQLDAQKAQLLGAAKQQVDALTAPVSSQIEALSALVEQAATSAARSVNEALAACSAKLTDLQGQLDTFVAAASDLEASLAAADAQLGRALGGVLALAGGA